MTPDGHSPEPWHIGEQTCMGGGSNHFVIEDANDRSIAGKVFGGHVRTAPVSVSMLDDDADRIVACVNYCAGVSTEELSRLSGNGFGLSEFAKRFHELSVVITEARNLP